MREQNDGKDKNISIVDVLII